MPGFWLAGKNAALSVSVTAFAPWDNRDSAHLEHKSSSETWMDMNVEL